MLKKRLIPLMLLDNGRLIKTIKFGTCRDVGDPVQSAKVYSDQNADELLILNVSRDDRTITKTLEILRELSKNCFMPLTVGGGITSIEDVRILIRSGADKVLINTAAYQDLDFLKVIAREFGSQALIIGIDCTGAVDKWQCLSNCGSVVENIELENHLRQVQEAGAGELLIQSVDRDGVMCGLDLDLLRRVTRFAKIPVIGAGGVGNYNDLLDGYGIEGIDAIGVASLFHFSDSNPHRAKAMLQNHNLKFKLV